MEMTISRKKIREIAPTVLFDTSGRLLLQLRDNIPGIIWPGKIGLFGGHREGCETFLECAVRELHEELCFLIPAEKLHPVAQLNGPDGEVPGGTVHAEFFVARDIPVDRLSITEGSLKIVEVDDLEGIVAELTPAALFALIALGLLKHP
jgi:8-oxo-dGTP pyrophosphatase MutT (NUDIX family)